MNMIYQIFFIVIAISFVTGIIVTIIQKKDTEKLDAYIMKSNVELLHDNPVIISKIEVPEGKLHNTIELKDVIEEIKKQKQTNCTLMDDEII